MKKSPILIIGAGPSGMMAAEQLAIAGMEVHLYEQQKAVARKFLVAGHGGFNLTHSEDMATFIDKYDAPLMQHMVSAFDNQATRAWLLSIGIATYVGSSGKVFPLPSIKPIAVLQAWIQRLKDLGVQIHTGYSLVDFDEHTVTLDYQNKAQRLPYQKLILALGGGSWKKTGSDGKWYTLFAEKNIPLAPFASANSGYHTVEDFAASEGQVLKNIVLHYEEVQKAGEIVFTQYGLEGSPVYYMNRFTRKNEFPLTLYIDLKPKLSIEKIQGLLRHSKNISETLKSKIKLAPLALMLLKKLDKSTFISADKLANSIKKYPIEVSALRPLDEVISTAGGVAFEGLTEQLALKSFPNIYCIGEMLNWEAPTGGYLLQGCFSSGAWVAKHLND